MSLLIPPLLLRLKIKSSEMRSFRIWIPAFIFLPLIYFFLMIIALVLTLVVLIYPARGRVRRAIWAFIEPFRFFHAIRGFTFEVESRDSEVLITIT